MIVDFKYHVASLVAVFLALGIGILIGSTMVGSDTLIEYQKQLADRLEAQLESLRQQNEVIQAHSRNLEIENNMQKEFEKEVLPLLVHGKLTGQQVAVVETGGYGYTDEIIKVIEMAGGKVASVTSLPVGVSLTAEDRELLERELGWKDLNQNQVVTKIAGIVCASVVNGGDEKTLKLLADSGLIKYTGDYGVPLNAVVVVGGSRDENLNRAETLDLPMIDFFIARKINVVGVEETNVAVSYMKYYQKKHMSTVDNVDTVPGQLAMVYALAGSQGHYGVKPTAQKMLPALEVP